MFRFTKYMKRSPDGAARTERPGLWRYSCGFGKSKVLGR